LSEALLDQAALEHAALEETFGAAVAFAEGNRATCGQTAGIHEPDDIDSTQGLTTFLEDLHFRIAVMLALSIITQFIEIFVAGNILLLRSGHGHNSTTGSASKDTGAGGEIRGSTLSLLFISIFLVDGKGFIFALIFGSQRSAMQTWGRYWRQALGCFRQVVYDIDEIDEGNDREGEYEEGEYEEEEEIVHSAGTTRQSGSGSQYSTTPAALSRRSNPGLNMASIPQGIPRRRKRAEAGQLEALTRTMSADNTLVQAIRHRMQVYEKCFRGSDAVTWLVHRRRVATRAEGESMAMKMLARGLLHHVTREHLVSGLPV
jgi:hypothetical protein